VVTLYPTAGKRKPVLTDVFACFYSGMTIDPAYASFSEDILGSLEPGKKADYVVLSKDIIRIEPREIPDVKVLATVMDGEVVYGKL